MSKRPSWAPDIADPLPAFQPRGVRSLLWFGLALSLLLPSTAVFQKYFGLGGVLLYGLVGALVLLFLAHWRAALSASVSSLTRQQLIALSSGLFLVLALLFAVVYPLANSGRVGGGSDGDDALNVAVASLLQGNYPYYQHTYLGNPISPMPGALLLAVPFVLMGTSAYQNFFWLFVFLLAAWAYLADYGQALLLLLLVLLLSPAVLYSIAVGSDYIANSLSVLVASLGVTGLLCGGRRRLHFGARLLFAILLGVSLSARANFLLLLPLVFTLLVCTDGWRIASAITLLIVTTFVLVTAPFFLYDPAYFSPLHTFGKLTHFEPILPSAGIIVAVVTSGLAILLAMLQLRRKNKALFLKGAFFVLAFPVLCGIVLASLGARRLDFGYAWFGLFFIFFGALAFWPPLTGRWKPPGHH